MQLLFWVSLLYTEVGAAGNGDIGQGSVCVQLNAVKYRGSVRLEVRHRDKGFDRITRSLR